MRDVFLKRFQRRREIFLVDGVLRPQHQRGEWVFLCLWSGLRRRLSRGFLLRLREQRHSGCGKREGNQPHPDSSSNFVCPENHFDDFHRMPGFCPT